MRYLASLGLIAALAGCGGQGLFERRLGAEAPVLPPPSPVVGPVSEPSNLPPPDSVLGNRDPLDAEATNPTGEEVPGAAADGRLGTTIASLGDPAESGSWLKTPLVSEPTSGRVVYPRSGRSVRVELLPLDAPPGGGSEISMTAMELLDAPIAGLPELVVYTNS